MKNPNILRAMDLDLLLKVVMRLPEFVGKGKEVPAPISTTQVTITFVPSALTFAQEAKEYMFL
jgi:hypothetical protein